MVIRIIFKWWLGIGNLVKCQDNRAHHHHHHRQPCSQWWSWSCSWLPSLPRCHPPSHAVSSGFPKSETIIFYQNYQKLKCLTWPEHQHVMTITLTVKEFWQVYIKKILNLIQPPSSSPSSSSSSQYQTLTAREFWQLEQRTLCIFSPRLSQVPWMIIKS